MKIDRTRFLLLTGVLSAGAACTVTSTNAIPDASAPAPAVDSGSDFDATTTPATEDGGVTVDGATPVLDAAVDSAPICDDSVGTLSACANYVDGGTDGAAFDAGNGCLTDQSCSSVLMFLKPRVAQNVIQCVSALPTACGDNPSTAQACLATALSGACPDPTAATACGQVIARCADAGAGDAGSEADCEKLASGLTAAGRTAFVTCVDESNCESVQSCFSQLF